jgi:hypothetical protein
MYHSTPANLSNTLKDNHQDKLNEIKEMIAIAKLEKMTMLEQQVNV